MNLKYLYAIATCVESKKIKTATSDSVITAWLFHHRLLPVIGTLIMQQNINTRHNSIALTLLHLPVQF